MAKASKAGDQIVKVCRRTQGERRGAKAEGVSTQPVKERRGKVQRRRQIDPTTCERDYSEDEIEFMRALDEYKRANGRMFPTCSEILEVVRGLGYQRTTETIELEEQVGNEVNELSVAVAEAVDTNAIDFDLDHDEF